MSELNVTKSVIVTRNEEEQVTIPEGIVEVMPVWKFLHQTVSPDF
jgi:hypothetical protein